MNKTNLWEMSNCVKDAALRNLLITKACFDAGKEFPELDAHVEKLMEYPNLGEKGSWVLLAAIGVRILQLETAPAPRVEPKTVDFIKMLPHRRAS